MLPNNVNNAGNSVDGSPLQHPQQQQQQQQQNHGFNPLQFNISNISPNNANLNLNNANNNNSNTATTLSSVMSQQFPPQPKWNDLPIISDVIASWSQQFQQQREELLIFLARDECAYLRRLLAIFSSSTKNTIGSIMNNSSKNSHFDYSDEDLRSELALVIKSILLLNDPEIIEYVTSNSPTFGDICAILEYDPELRTRANHVQFLSEHAKFRTVILMDDEGDLVNSIHRLFRVNYMRDVVLRPTMDEGSLSTLVSLGQFMMSDIVKGVVLSNAGSGNGNAGGHEDASAVPLGDGGGCGGQNHQSGGGENYLIRVIRMLGREIQAIQRMKWKEHEKECGSSSSSRTLTNSKNEVKSPMMSNPPSPVDSPVAGPPTPPQSPMPPSSSSQESQSTITWGQHLAPQDPSLPSRLLRRKGCLSFLNELFNMARMSLQQHEKDDFVETTVTMMVPLNDGHANNDENDGNNVNESASGRQQSNSNVNLLSLFSSLLADPSVTDPKERGCALDIIGVIAMHDPSLIRKYCLDYVAYETELKKQAVAATSNNGIPTGASKNDVRPDPNDAREVLFTSPPNDLLLSLIFVMGTEKDAGLLLQTSEIIRIILDTELMGEQPGQDGQCSPGGSSFLDEENDFNAANNGNGNDGNGSDTNIQMMGNSSNSMNENSSLGGLGIMAPSGAGTVESEQNSFLALFYDRYIQWLVVPFQYKIFVPRLMPPSSLLAMDDCISSNSSCSAMNRIRREFKERHNNNDKNEAATAKIGQKRDDDDDSNAFQHIEPCHVRSSFILEILSFCIRAHVHRMKFFLLRTRLLGIILKILLQKPATTPLLSPPWSLPPQSSEGIRCLKLASLKLLRSVLSVKDEFYHRHIVQYNLFSPVFDLFCEGGTFVGNNLISSAVLEMCDFIRIGKIKSLIDYIVTKHLSHAMNAPTANDPTRHSLEDIANPHVDTFKQLRKVYEDNAKAEQGGNDGAVLLNRSSDEDNNMNGSQHHDGMQLMMNGRGRSILNKKGLEDQRKFREADEEDSYFNEDDDDVVATAEVEMGTNDANTGVTADFAAAAPPDEKGSTTEDVASLMEDVKTLDQ